MKFEVFKDTKVVEQFDLHGAYAFAADGIPLRSVRDIAFSEGFIEYEKRSQEASGLALLWPVEGFGKVMLATTCLPDRPEPYNLNLELARSVLMHITIKREEWAFFEETSSFVNLAHEAQHLFIEALKKIRQAPEASRLADESIQKAMEFSEALASKHAEIFLNMRKKSKGLGRHTLGCQVDPERIEDETYCKYLFDMFGFVTIPIRWSQVEPERGHYDFSLIDECIEKLGNRRMAICVGPLLSFTQEDLPSWILEKQGEYERVREAAYEFVSMIISRYKRYVHAWRVISGMNVFNELGFTFEQMIEMTRTACVAAKTADAKSRKLVEIRHPWGEYYATVRNSVPPLVYVDMVIQTGISFDALSVQIQFGSNLPGLHLRDMMQISSRLDCFVPVPKPLHISAVGVPGPEKSVNDINDHTGIWRHPWNQQTQSEWIECAYKIMLGKPFVHSVTWSSLADSDNGTIPYSGLLTEKLEPKKAYATIAKFQKMIMKKK